MSSDLHSPKQDDYLLLDEREDSKEAARSRQKGAVLGWFAVASLTATALMYLYVQKLSSGAEEPLPSLFDPANESSQPFYVSPQDPLDDEGPDYYDESDQPLADTGAFGTGDAAESQARYSAMVFVMNLMGLSLVVAIHSFLVKWIVSRGAKGSKQSSSCAKQATWLDIDGKLPPILNTLQRMRTDDRIDGAAVQGALKYSNLLDLLVNTTDVVFQDPTARGSLSHTELVQFIRTVDFQSLGLGPGDRMACVVPNSPEAAVLILCCFAKCTIVPLNPASTSQEILLDAGRVKAKSVIVHKDYMESEKQSSEMVSVANQLSVAMFALTPDVAIVGKFSLSHVHGSKLPPLSLSHFPLSCREDQSLMLFTSGTSGSKKLVPYTLDTLLVGATCIAASWELRPSDKVCNMMPLFHVGGITRNVLSPVLSGGSAVLCSSFDPILFWDIVEQQGSAVTWYYAGPVMHQLILDEFKHRGKSRYEFRFIANAAGGLLPSLALQMRHAYGCTVLPGYGMTECMPISAPPLSYKLDREGTSGTRVGPKLKIFNDDGVEVPPGQVGNIVVKGAPLFHGYEGDAESTREAFFPGGWFNTGDLGWLDKDGYLYITGRSKEVINRGGEIISPFEVEEAIQSHPRIKAVIAFSVPHAVLEEGIGIVVVPEENQPRVSLWSVQQWCKKSLTFAKWPQVMVLMSDLPKNNVNKPLRVKLAERLRLKEHWGGAMVDGMPEVTRTFFADCPEKGASLKEPIANVRMLSLNMDLLGQRLGQVGADLGIRDVALALVGTEKRLCACVTPESVDTKQLIDRVRASWDDWDIPTITTALAALPRSESVDHETPGPVDQIRLAKLLEVLDPNHVSPATSTERKLQTLWEDALQKERVSADADFFDLGGSSLLVGPLTGAIQESLHVGLTAVDVFNAPTIQKLAALIDSRRSQESSIRKSSKGASMKNEDLVLEGRSWGCTNPVVLAVQMLPCLLFQPTMKILSYVSFILLFVWTQSFLGGKNLESLVAAVLLTSFIMSILSPLLFIVAKWTIIGTYREGQFPAFGTMYMRWWLVNQLQTILGPGILANRLALFYRLLGAKIGDGVKISSDSRLSEFDLITIESNAALDCCVIRPFTLNPGRTFSLLRIHIGGNSVVCAKSVVAGGAHLPKSTCIGPLSSSHELKDARPENRQVCRVLRQEPPYWLQVLCGWPILLLQKIVTIFPIILLMLQMMTETWYVKTIRSVHDGLEYVSTPARMAYLVAFLVCRKTVCCVCALAFAILTKQLLIGNFVATPDGAEPDRSDWELFRTWLLSRLIPDAHLCGVSKLLGGHYEAVSALYRLLGVKVGKYVYWPGSGFRFSEPDLVEIGDYVVFGSRSIFMTSDASHRRQAIRVEAGSNISDRCVVLPGTTVKCGAVLGSGALTRQGATYNAGTYVGSRGNDCVLLKKPNGKTQVPTESSYSRAFTRSKQMPYVVLPECAHWAWNTACISFTATVARCPVVLSLLLLQYHVDGDWRSYSARDLLVLFTCYMYCVFPFVFMFALAVDIGSKWALLGRREPGSHSWDSSSYCQRWQLHLALAHVRSFSAVDYLDLFRGSQFLVWYFRMMGASIGKHVCLYPNGADPMMTEPDLVTIHDGAGIDDASLISHLNTGGVFTINHLEVGESAVMRTSSRLQQSAIMEAGSVLMEHTLVLPADTVKKNEWRQGWPAGQGWVP